MSRNQRAPRAKTAPKAPSSTVRRGPHLGPLRITPVRVFLAIALVGGMAFLAWSVFARDASYQVPMMATGFAVCGIVLAVMAGMSVGRIISAGREGRDGIAVITALVGGILAMAAMLMLAGAVIMSLIWSTAKSG
jgi:uncharacterized ion transporter superfamily protein YfcC